jgi:hypothetical protein
VRQHSVSVPRVFSSRVDVMHEVHHLLVFGDEVNLILLRVSFVLVCFLFLRFLVALLDRLFLVRHGRVLVGVLRVLRMFLGLLASEGVGYYLSGLGLVLLLLHLRGDGLVVRGRRRDGGGIVLDWGRVMVRLVGRVFGLLGRGLVSWI